MQIIQSVFDGQVHLLEPLVHGDARGYFFEAFHADKFAQLGMHGPWLQDNHSLSQRGVLRGLHFQYDEAQGKLVRAAQGSALDVVVDLRAASPTFGQHVVFALDDTAHRQVWVPPGFGHAFLALSSPTQLRYKCTALYNAAGEGGINPLDPALAIDWPLPLSELQLSARDQAAMSFADYAAAPRF